MKRKRFLRNICILTAGSIALRLIGIGFSGWLSRKIGAEGMGLFQLVFSVYSLASTIATSGIYLAVTRLVAEELGKGNEHRAAGAMRVCMIYASSSLHLHQGFCGLGADYWNKGSGRCPDGRFAESIGRCTPIYGVFVQFNGYFSQHGKYGRLTPARFLNN